MKLDEEARRHMKTIVKEVKGITIDIADNGYILNYSGCTEEETYESSTEIYKTLDEVLDKVKLICDTMQ